MLPCVVIFVTSLRSFFYICLHVSLWLFMRLGAHLANWPCIAFWCPSCQLPLPCIAFGRPSCELALPCFRARNLGEAVLKTLPPSQNWFLSILQLVFLPSAPFVWSFSLRLFVRFLTAVLANRPCIAFGCPSCGRAVRPY